MKSAIVKFYCPEGNPEAERQRVETAMLLFAEVDGVVPEGFGWSVSHRIDADYLALWIQSTDEVIDSLVQNHDYDLSGLPTIEIIKKLEGWPEQTEIERQIDEINNGSGITITGVTEATDLSAFAAFNIVWEDNSVTITKD